MITNGNVPNTKIQTVTQETLDMVKTNLMEKAITTNTGLIGYSLEAPAKQLVPFASPFRNRTPRKVSPTGTAAHWKVIKEIKTTGKITAAEGQRGNAITYTVADALAAFKIISLQDSVTFESIAAGRNFDDVRARAGTNLLFKIMTEEEMLLIGGNGSQALPTIANPTISTASTGGSIAAGTYNVKVAPLTLTAANRIVLNVQQANLNLGVFDGVGTLGTVSTGALTGSTSTVTATVAPVKGAMAYAWFVGTAGNETLQIVTTISKVTFTSLVAGGTNASAVTVDTTCDTLAFDGLIPQIIAGGGYYKDLGGTCLTKANGGVQELDDMFAYMWNVYKLSPSRIMCGSQGQADITSAIIAGAGAPTLMVNNGDKGNITGNWLATQYINKSANGQVIPIETHPWLPDGCMMILTESLPYPNTEIPNVFEVECGYDYMQIEYPVSVPKYEFEVRAWEVLKAYFPASCAIITNAAKGIQ